MEKKFRVLLVYPCRDIDSQVRTQFSQEQIHGLVLFGRGQAFERRIGADEPGVIVLQLPIGERKVVCVTANPESGRDTVPQ